MGWQAVTLTYRAMGPLLLGDHPLGFIQRTRHFIPGWTLWGALTATLTRAAFPQADGARYEGVGDWVANNLLTSYAYLLVEGQPAFPHFAEGRWRYGPLPAAQFEARFVTSLGQTAIAPESLTAQTNTLHETEALSACDLEDGTPARWQFTMYWRVGKPVMSDPDKVDPYIVETLAALSPDDLIAALQTLTVGAERGYGLGRLEQESAVPQRPAGDNTWPVPLDWSKEDKILRAHVRVGAPLDKAVRGRAEAIPWRWWKNTPDPDGRSWGPGQQQRVQCFYVPGCVVVKDAAWTPVIGPRGIWQKG